MSEQSWQTNDLGQSQTSTGAGGEGGDNYQEPSVRKINASTFVLVLAFGAAIGAIWLMGVCNKPRQANAMQDDLEAEVARTITVLQENNNAQAQGRSSTDILINTFRAFLDSTKQGNSELKKNPFDFDGNHNSSHPANDNNKTETTPPVKLPENDATRRIADIVSEMKLQSVVVMDKNSMAIINNRVVRVGATIEGLTVISIESTRVTLGHDKNTFELKLKSDKP